MGLFALPSHAQIDTLRISTSFTTHIIFSTDVTYADLSNSRIVAARIVEQNKNMLAIKARCPFEEATSVSALESNGKMHTYIVVYEPSPKSLIIDTRARQDEYHSPTSDKSSNVTRNRQEDAPKLSDILQQKQRLYHLGDHKYKIKCQCEDIVSYSDITYLLLSIDNKSSVSYNITDATFVIESKKRGKRTVAFEKTIFPEGRQGSLACAAGEASRMAYSFKKITLSEDQVLKIYFYEESGQRNLTITLDSNDINKAGESL